MWLEVACAAPLEPFRQSFSLTCGEGRRSCSGVLRGPTTLGGSTGITITKGDGGEVELEIDPDRDEPFALSADKINDFSMTLSWDGDSNPDQLSASGLPCIDLTAAGAYAFVFPRVSVVSECKGQPPAPGCPSFVVESRIYNPSDPTGQKFLSSVITRAGEGVKDLTVPFSNFVMRGPRGGAAFSCVGAVTLTFRFSGFKELELNAAGLHTNGPEGLTPLPTATREPTATGTPTPTCTPTSSPSVTPMATPSVVPAPAVAGVATASLVMGIATEVSAVSVTPGASAPPSGSLPLEPSSGEAEDRSIPTVSSPALPQGEAEEEETVYGEVVVDD
jgi:hypothetical protein